MKERREGKKERNRETVKPGADENSEFWHLSEISVLFLNLPLPPERSGIIQKLSPIDTLLERLFRKRCLLRKKNHSSECFHYPEIRWPTFRPVKLFRPVSIPLSCAILELLLPIPLIVMFVASVVSKDSVSRVPCADRLVLMCLV